MTSEESIWPSGPDVVLLRQMNEAIQRLDRRAVVVEPRIIPRIIRLDRGIMGVFTRIPHEQCYWISRAALNELADAQEIPLLNELSPSDTVMLLSAPKGGDGLPLPPQLALPALQRQMFHLKVHMALQNRGNAGRLTPALLRRRIHEIGQTEFDEIRFVLQREHLVLPPRDAATMYAEFAATFLELRHFASHLLACYFPAIWHTQAVEDILARDVNALELLAECGLTDGKPSHPLQPSTDADANDEDEGSGNPQPPLSPTPAKAQDPATPAAHKNSSWLYRHFLARSRRVIKTGNVVRGAICLTRAAWATPHGNADELHRQAKETLEQLAGPLGDVLGFSITQREQLSTLLQPLLAPASRGYWPREARLLYELQKACVDHHRELFSVDVVPWLISLGRQKLIRPLPVKRQVLIVQHLRGAIEKLSGTALPDRLRHELLNLLGPAIRTCENRLREYVRGILAQALIDAKLEPHSIPETVARDKIIEELLDRVMERGILTMGDLRDAISRNGLKLPDLGGSTAPRAHLGAGHFLRECFAWFALAVMSFFAGGKLLQFDNRLARSMDGAYHHGEFYMRWLQRFSQLMFGTSLGRLLTLFGIVPFGGAFIILEGAHHLVHLVCEPPEWIHSIFESDSSIIALGLYLLALVNFSPARRASKWFFRHVFRVLHTLLVDAPRWLADLPAMRQILRGRPYRIFQAYVPVPLALGATAWLILCQLGVERTPRLIAGGLTAAVLSFLLNTTNGRRFQELTAMRIAYVWQFARRNILLGTIQIVMEAFKRGLELLERLLFTIDQWLRFRSGGSRFSLVLKGILSVPWFIVSYVLRFVVNLLVEPQINPTKHFPVVTVSHKMILPTIPSMGRFLRDMFGMTPVAANTAATTIATSIPGIFGFLVWELMGNWRLFRANRPKNLSRAAVGSHGESMIRLMRPGLHSGTLPKLFARLRHAQRKAPPGTTMPKVRTLRRKLHHVEESLRHFIKRELLHLLGMSAAWAGVDVILSQVRLASNRISFELQCPPLGPASLWLAFDEQSGWLLAGVLRKGWLAAASEAQRQALAAALAGFYKIAGVDMVREQIQAILGPGVAYDIAENALLVWPGSGSAQCERNPDAGYNNEVAYNLAGGKLLPPEVTDGKNADMPVLNVETVVFRHSPISWQNWISTWKPHADDIRPEPLVKEHRILPPL